MEINAYLRPLVRWWRLIAIVTILAVVSSAVSVFLQPDLYVSRTTLVVGTTILDPNPDAGQIYIAQQLASIYADMAKREPIQVATMEALGIDWLPQYDAKVIPNTQMIEISVTDTNPRRAQIIANELANQLRAQSPAIGDTETGIRQEFIDQQLSSLQVQIQDTERKIEELQRSLIGLKSASQISNIEREINSLSQRLSTLRENYASLLANSQKGALNILSVVEPANLPTRAAGTNKFIIIALAAVFGFTLGAGAAYLLEFFDRTIRTTSDVEKVFNLPVIGYISEVADENSATYVARNPDSILAENFRFLQSNIDFIRISNPIKTLLITSPLQGNGKTTIASNLALSFAQSEEKVLLVDADLRRPAVHTALKINKAPGLADVIRNTVNWQGVVQSLKGERIQVIPAGNVPSNITEVAGSKRIATILSELKKNFELIIVDAPPLIISDSFNLASRVDGVILVMVPGQTTIEQARTIKDQLDRAKAKMLGVVFNKISSSGTYTYDDYQYQSLYAPKYYGDYISASSKKEKPRVSRSKKLLAFFERGEVPPEVGARIESAITAIKTQPRDLVNRIRKSRKNGKTRG